ncbi:unnamed protein product (macronuclear) [Paramecium tetraurelia]|uniref:Uncharacterized protein n=1 Tax=Paramecium tetraurelia TaxID=5888 RepID=A0DHC4_PARTE|nr:uncharacterized protein GSPATT00016828001 [Paramecium tetraurelia]CAK82441.1 unnamed protein product [Paramecium tetraurelia]|eukprot:XP_001449838.1 hypothetical protein (macronuclear) [Paramecium tetraurelia strain d4-2]
MNQTFSRIRPKTTDSKIRNSSNHQLISQLFQQINSYYEQEEKPRPKTQSRQRKIIPLNYSQSDTYDPTDNLIDRLCPTIQQDAKFIFIKTRERALRQPSSGSRRKKMIEEPKFQLNPIKKTTIIQEISEQTAPPKKTIEQKTEHSFYLVKQLHINIQFYQYALNNEKRQNEIIQLQFQLTFYFAIKYTCQILMSHPSTLLEYQPAKQPNPNIIKLLTQHQDLFLIQNQPPSTLGAPYPLKLDAKEMLIEVQPDQKFTHPKYFQKDNKVQKITKQPSQPASTIFVESGLCDPNKKAWYYLDEAQKSQGPFTSAEIDQLITKGTINMQTKVALETLDKLVRVEKIIQAVNKKKEADQKLKEAQKQKSEEQNQQKSLDSPTKIEKQEELKLQQIKQKEEQGIDFEIDYSKIKQNIQIGQWAKPLVAQPIQVKVTKAFTNNPQQSKQQQKQTNKPTERKRSDNKSMHVEGNKGNLYQKKGYERQEEVILEAKPKEESDATINQEVQDYLKKLDSKKPEKAKEETQQQPEKQPPQQQTQVPKTQKLKTEPPKQEQKLQTKQQVEKVDSADEEWEIVGAKKNTQTKKDQQQKQTTKVEQQTTQLKKQEQQQQQQQQQQKQELKQEQKQEQQQQQDEEDDDEDEDGWQTVGASNKDKKKPVNKKIQQKNSHIPGFAVEIKTDSITISSGSAKKPPPQKQKKPEPVQQQQPQQSQPQNQPQNNQNDDDDEGWIEVEVGQAPKKVTQSKKGK